MNNEKTKTFLLYLFITLVLGGSLWAALSLAYSPIKELRNNNILESNSYKENNNENNSINNNINQNNTNSKTDTNISSISTIIPVETEIAKYTTTIYDTEESRIHNIKLAISKLDNTIVNKYEEFSFNDTIGPMGQNEGYQKATGFDGNGKKIKIYGGGMCQISSTLYNAVLIANLEVTERHPHSRRVYYVPQDKDASVAYGGANFKFKNTSENKIKINATTDGHDVTITLYKIE